MKPSILLSSAVCILFAVSGCRGINCINGSGNQISQNRSVNPFTNVEVGGSVKLVLKQDATQLVRIVADDNIQNEIKTRVSGNTLNIDMDGNFCDAGPITIYLHAKNFERVNASGAVEVISDGKLKVQDFDLDLSGSSKVMLDINARSVRTQSSGSSEINLKGQAGTHEVDLSGSAEVNALDFTVGKYDISTSGASEVKINVLNELNVSTSGSSDVEYRGNPKTVNNEESGSSSLRKIE